MQMATIHVQAHWDEEAGVWTASSLGIEGLAVEAASVEALEAKIGVAIRDLLEANGSVARPLSAHH